MTPCTSSRRETFASPSSSSSLCEQATAPSLRAACYTSTRKSACERRSQTSSRSRGPLARITCACDKPFTASLLSSDFYRSSGYRHIEYSISVLTVPCGGDFESAEVQVLQNPCRACSVVLHPSMDHSSTRKLHLQLIGIIPSIQPWRKPCTTTVNVVRLALRLARGVWY